MMDELKLLSVKDDLIKELKNQLAIQQAEIAKRDELISRISLDLAVLAGETKLNTNIAS